MGALWLNEVRGSGYLLAGEIEGVRVLGSKAARFRGRWAMAFPA